MSETLPAGSSGGRELSRAAATTRSTGWLVAAQGISLAVGFAVWAYAARVLSTDRFGEVQLGIAVGTYLALFSTVGLTPLCITEFGDQPRPRRYVLRLQTIRVVHTVVVVGALAAAAWSFPRLLTTVVAICATSVVLRQLWPEWADIALDASHRVALVRSVYFAAVLAATVLVVRSAGDAAMFGLILAVAAVVAGVPAWGLTVSHLRKLGRPLPDEEQGPRLSWSAQWGGTMRRALPLGTGNVLGQLLANADVLLLGGLASREAVALYGAAYRIIFAIQGAGVALRYASLRALSLPSRPHEDRQKFERDLLLLTFMASIIIAAVAATVAPTAISLAYGAKYARSAPLLQILVWTWPLDFSSAVVLNFLIVQHRRRRYVTAMAAAAAVNLAANALVIPRFGAGGAAVVIVASLALLLVLALWFMEPKQMMWRRSGSHFGLALVALGLGGSVIAEKASNAIGLGLLLLVAGAAAYALYRAFGSWLVKGGGPRVAAE